MNQKDQRSPVRKILTRVVELMNHLPGADRIAVRHYTINSSRLPDAFDGFTIVQISDLHGRWFGKQQERLIDAVKKQKPDLILCTGDWVDMDYQGADQKCCEVLIRGLKPIAPVYGIIGNHEARADHKTYMLAQMKKMGVPILYNQSVRLVRNGQSIGLTGFATSYRAPLREEEKEKLKLEKEYSQAIRGVESECFHIAMGHRPELIALYSRLGLDLVLSGHAHGGLMRLPKGYRLLAPGQGWLPKHTHGAYREGSTWMLVSCGLGGPRIGIAPEISQIILKK